MGKNDPYAHEAERKVANIGGLSFFHEAEFMTWPDALRRRISR